MGLGKNRNMRGMLFKETFMQNKNNFLFYRVFIYAIQNVLVVHISKRSYKTCNHKQNG